MLTKTKPVAEPEPEKLVRVRPKHHVLVRISHWLNIPLLLGLAWSGLSIYWAAPVYHHPADPVTGSTDYVADLGFWMAEHIPHLHLIHGRLVLFHEYGDQADWVQGTRYSTSWVYDHFSLGTGLLAEALRLHWLFAYAWMANGALYMLGLALGGGYRALLPRKGDLRGAMAMQIYYLGLLPMKLLKRPWKHPEVTTKYNPMQRLAYFSMPVAGALSIATGWAIHKPAQLGWLQAIFGGYDFARVLHFWLMWFYLAFVIPHVILVIADGWDTFRSMITGWSKRVPGK